MGKIENKFKAEAKTFYLASFFFTNEKKKEVEILYNFCRYVDDIGDKNGNKKKKIHQLKSIKKDIIKKNSKIILIRNFINLLTIYKININIVFHLIDGVLFDTNVVNIKNESDLEEYSYKVAGTVGLMMCSLMGIKDKKLLNHALELGIAMQITNICRDIKEDLLINRIYFPNSLRQFNYISNKDLLKNKKKQKVLSENINFLIRKSNNLYKESNKGVMKLPLKYRIVILIASRMYQEIGLIISKNPYYIWKKRVFVSIPKKIIIIIGCFIKLIFSFMFKVKEKKRFKTNYYEKFLSTQ